MPWSARPRRRRSSSGAGRGGPCGCPEAYGARRASGAGFWGPQPCGRRVARRNCYRKPPRPNPELPRALRHGGRPTPVRGYAVTPHVATTMTLAPASRAPVPATQRHVVLVETPKSAGCCRSGNSRAEARAWRDRGLRRDGGRPDAPMLRFAASSRRGVARSKERLVPVRQARRATLEAECALPF